MRARTILITAILCMLTGVEEALAWGPTTHVSLARSILDQLGLLPVGVAAILGRNAVAYIYGNIAADVVFAKRLSRVKQFCHHWSTAFRLLDTASDDRARAFAYGYLSHLAADTIAHGKYIPRQIILSGCTVGFGHLYWELRADSTASETSRRVLEDVLALDHSEHHVALAKHIQDTFLSYDLNRLLFDRINATTVRNSFRRTVNTWARYSRWHLSPELMSGYRAECLDRIVAILTDGPESSLLREDPNGTSALMHLRIRRREWRRMRRKGACTRKRVVEVSRGYSPAGEEAPPTVRKKPLAPVTTRGGTKKITLRA